MYMHMHLLTPSNICLITIYGNGLGDFSIYSQNNLKMRCLLEILFCGLSGFIQLNIKYEYSFITLLETVASAHANLSKCVMLSAYMYSDLTQ